MINTINEKIYNYIFSVNAELRNNNDLNIEQCQEKLDKIILEKYDIVADFWDENKNEFNENCVIKTQTLDMINPIYIYRNFPRMKSSIKAYFLEYKANQIKEKIEDNGEFLKESLNDVFEEIENLGIKEILDYCQSKGLVKYIGDIFYSADDNPAYSIMFDNIRANLIKNNEEKMDKNILKTGFLIEYNLVKKITDSANAEIWIVSDKEGKEYIAKILNKNISTEKLKRYRNEINFSKRNLNKYLIEIIDNGIKNIDGIDYMFYIMPKYDCDFRMLMKEGIDNSKILEYFNQILEGIKFIHHKKGFHRDIKPENILYDKQKDILVVTDLGIAHFNEEDLIDNPKTRATSRMANYIYAAPEQRVKGLKVNHRCDIYALGLILNELFTGQVIQGSNYKRISEVNEEYTFLDEIVEKMTNQNPDDRYNSIEEIQYAINANIEIYEKDKREQELKKINIEKNIEDDILVSDPIKIVDVSIDDEYRLIIRFNNSINDLWLDTLMHVDKTEIFGYGPERFLFKKDTAVLNLNQTSIKSVPQIIECFKQWILSTNNIYPKKRNEQNEKEKRIKEEKIKKEILANEELKEIIKKIKI